MLSLLPLWLEKSVFSLDYFFLSYFLFGLDLPGGKQSLDRNLELRVFWDFVLGRRAWYLNFGDGTLGSFGDDVI